MCETATAVEAFCKSVADIQYYGTEKWLNDYYTPVLGTEFENVSNRLLDGFQELFHKHQDDIHVVNFLSANLNIVIPISTILFKINKLTTLQENGEKIMSSKGPLPITDILIEDLILNDFDWDFKTFSLLRKAYHLLLSVKQFLFPLSKFHKKVTSQYLIIDYPNRDTISYCRRENINPVFVNPYIFLNIRSNKATEFFNGTGKTIIEMFDTFLSVYSFLRPTHKKILSEKIQTLLKQNYSLFSQCVHISRIMPQKFFFINALGGRLHRLFAAAWRSSKKEVIGFTHGNLLGNYDPVFSLIEATTIDTYFVNTEGEKKAADYFLKKYPYSYKEVKVVNIESSKYREFIKKNSTGKVESSISNIMLVGFPMEPRNVMFKWEPEQHALSQCYLELSILKLMKENNFHTTYKPHPHQFDCVGGIFSQMADHIAHERFEDVFNDVDCILFAHPNTTTFGYSLLSDKPIVLMNNQGRIWYPEFLEVLEKRCAIVNTWIDQQGKVLFHPQDLISAIHTAPKLAQNDSVKEMFAY